MSQKGLDVSYIHARLQEGSRKCVAKHMGCNMCLYVDALKVFVDNSPNRLGS